MRTPDLYTLDYYAIGAVTTFYEWLALAVGGLLVLIVALAVGVEAWRDRRRSSRWPR